MACYEPTSADVCSTLFLITKQSLSDKSLLIAPVLVNNKNFRILVTNPSDCDVFLQKNTKAAEAVEVFEEPSKIITPRSTKTDIPLFKEALITTLEEAWSEAAKNSQRAQEEYQKRANQGAQGSNLRTGDRVMYKDYTNHKGLSRKLSLPWGGDYRIVEINSPLAVIRDNKRTEKPLRTVHLDQIKRFWTPTDDDEEEAEVDNQQKTSADEPEDVADDRKSSDSEDNDVVEPIVVDYPTSRQPEPRKTAKPLPVATNSKEAPRRNPPRQRKIPAKFLNKF
uniref:Uncharacterized protein n=1 Tax=Caenorhabditis japonica TaxID=281687 RepID=A0A8R1DUB8_CAEJA